MGLRDIFKPLRSASKATLPPSSMAPLPISQSGRQFTFYGNGRLVSMLRRPLPGSHKDWVNEAGDLGLNSILACAMDWYIRNWPQCRFQIIKRIDPTTEETVVHPVLELLNNPCMNMVASMFYGWVMQDYKFFGNAYVRKIRPTSGGVPTALQFLPQDMVTPVGDGLNPLTHYLYCTDGRQYEIPVEDIIHFRYGRDPLDIRLGRSPVQSVLREVATDNIVSSAAYGLMGNGAMPSLIIAPDVGNGVIEPSEDDLRTAKRKLQEELTGDNAGGIVMMSGPYKIERVSLSPSELSLGEIRKTPEERVCSSMGLNPMVLGLGAGLDRSTYSNYAQAQQAAWEDGMIPMLNVLADTLTNNLLVDFEGENTELRVSFDLRAVKALADDKSGEAARARLLYTSGIIDLAEAKRIASVTPDKKDEGVMFGQFNEDLALDKQNMKPRNEGPAVDTAKALSICDCSAPEVASKYHPFYGYQMEAEG